MDSVDSAEAVCPNHRVLGTALFTVTVANEAGVDLVLIQPFLLYYVKLVVVMLTSIF